MFSKYRVDVIKITGRRLGIMIGVPAFAEKFKISEDTVRRWCRERKIAGAEQDGKGQPWRIPENAVPPVKQKT